MRLRPRLALAILVAAVPVVAGLAWTRSRLEWRSAEQGLVQYAVDRMESGGREACEDDPQSFPLGPPPPRDRPPLGRPGPRRPPNPLALPERGRPPPPESRPDGPPRNELWAYASDFTSANPNAPPFPPELRARLAAGEAVASSSWSLPRGEGIQVGLRMAWSDGPCAIVLTRRPEIGPQDTVRDLVIGGVVLCAVLLASVTFVAGPVVERVAKLGAQVRASAASRYRLKTEVGGADEVSELASAFNAAADEVRANLDELEAREKALRTFVENTTHDVMLPLTVLQGQLTALRRAAESREPANSRTVAEALQEAHYMASLIQNLSAAARLESGAPVLERHRFDLAQLVERAVARHAPIARAREIALEHAVPPEPLWIEGDVTFVEQAASNLIHNAVRYVEPGGHVAVILERQAREFSLRVLDDGPGIPPELQAKVFERSFRTDAARSRHPSGLGLGLSIAKDVAERHGFELTLRRPEAGGAELELRGPLPESPAA